MEENTRSKVVKELQTYCRKAYKMSCEYEQQCQQVSNLLSSNTCRLVKRLQVVPTLTNAELGVLQHFHSLRQRLCSKLVQQFEAVYHNLALSKTDMLQLIHKLQSLQQVIEGVFNEAQPQLSLESLCQRSPMDPLPLAISDYIQYFNLLVDTLAIHSQRASLLLSKVNYSLLSKSSPSYSSTSAAIPTSLPSWSMLRPSSDVREDSQKSVKSEEPAKIESIIEEWREVETLRESKEMKEVLQLFGYMSKSNQSSQSMIEMSLADFPDLI